jgi:hypothetical protein
MAKVKVNKKFAEDPKNPGFDTMGQPLGTQGEPDEEALETLGQIPDIPEDENSAEPVHEATTLPAPPEPNGEQSEFERRLVEGLDNPAVARAVGDAISKDPNLRDRFGIRAGQGPPSGVYRRDYEREPALAVTGGREVAHERGFEPDPPSYIRKYVGQQPNTTTDYASLDQVPPDRRQNANVAARDPQGQPLKTDEYKLWVDKQNEGGRLDGKVRTDISVGAFNIEGATESAAQFVAGDEGAI